MQIEYESDGISFEKELNDLDRLALDFTGVVEECGISYVLVSGYVAILFGRNRSSEDIDIIMEHLDRERFMDLWNRLNRSFECIICSKRDAAYDDYISQGIALRFARKDSIIPNMEVKFPRNGAARWTLRERVKVSVNGNPLYVSPMEMQIPYKLFLGSDKDIEDAKYLYILFEDQLDREIFDHYITEFEQEETFLKYIREVCS